MIPLYDLALLGLLPLTVFIVGRLRMNQQRLAAVEARLDTTDLRLKTLERNNAPERATGSTPASQVASPVTPPQSIPRVSPPPTARPATPVSAVPKISERPTAEPTVRETRPPQSPAPGRDQAAPSAKPSAKSAFNWEQFMGVRLFAWLGGLALFLAAAFFIKYSFDNGLISQELRVAIGFLAGAAALAGGFRMNRNRYRVTADTLCAAGVVILYAVTFTGHAVYQFPLFSAATTFGAMMLITTAAFVLSMRFGAQVIAILGMLGGFLTPLLVSSDTQNATALFMYIAMLDAGLLTVADKKRWDWLALGSAIGTVMMQWMWIGSSSSPLPIIETVPVFLGFCAFYTAAVAKASRDQRLNPWLSYGAIIPAFSTLLYVFLHLTPAGLGERPAILYGLLLGTDLCVLAISLWWTRLKGVPAAQNAIVFIILAAWTAGAGGEQFLLWALGGYVGFGVIHAGVPLLIQAKRPGSPVSLIGSLMPIVSLLLVIVPLIRVASWSTAIWTAILMINFVAITTALLMASAAGILLAFVFTSITAFIWILTPLNDSIPSTEMLPVIAGLAVVFTLVPRCLRPFTDRIRQRHPFQVAAPAWLKVPDKIAYQLPALVPPFLLLSLLIQNHTIAHPWPVFATSLGLGALGLLMHRLVRIAALPLVALGGTLLVELVWHGGRDQAHHGGSTLAWYLGSSLLFFLYPFTTMKGAGTQRLVWVAGALAGVLHFLPVYDLWKDQWPNQVMGLIPLGFAIPPLLALHWLNKQLPQEDPSRLSILAWLGGCGLLFITLIFPIQFEHEWLTLAWCLEGTALLWLFRRLPARGLLNTGLALLAIGFARLCINPAVLGYHPHAAYPLLNWYSYTYGIAIVCLWLGARLMPAHTTVRGTRVRPLYYAMTGITTFVLLNIQIADFFTEPGQPVLRFVFGQNLASDMTYTIAWAIFALLLMIVGIRQRNQPTRYAGIGLMAVTLLKLFLYDMASLTQLYRVGAFVGIAAIAMLTSLIYQKFLGSDSMSGGKREGE